MRADCQWHEDVEQYVMVTIGQPGALTYLVDYIIADDIKNIDINISHYEHTSIFKCRKSAWEALSNEMKLYIKSFAQGFAKGFDYGKEFDR